MAQLVKEGILGAFSVGFRVKDADYLTETDGLKIKDAELFSIGSFGTLQSSSNFFSGKII